METIESYWEVYRNDGHNSSKVANVWHSEIGSIIKTRFIDYVPMCSMVWTAKAIVINLNPRTPFVVTFLISRYLFHNALRGSVACAKRPTNSSPTKTPARTDRK